jgi:hypothetical protein
LLLSSQKYGLGTQNPGKTHTGSRETGSGTEKGTGSAKDTHSGKEREKTAMISQWHRHEKGRRKRKGEDPTYETRNFGMETVNRPVIHRHTDRHKHRH